MVEDRIEVVGILYSTHLPDDRSSAPGKECNVLGERRSKAQQCFQSRLCNAVVTSRVVHREVCAHHQQSTRAHCDERFDPLASP